MMRPIPAVAMITLGALGAGPVMAEPASERISLSASVAPFCKVDGSGSSAGETADGRVELGLVRETCNLAGGYVIRARFANLSGGTLVAGNEQVEIDEEGYATLQYGEARAQARDWTVVNARKVDVEAPVALQLSIASF